MIAEKTNTAQEIISAISATAGKVDYINNMVLANALLYLENKGIPTSKHEDYKYCNLDAILKKEFKDLKQQLKDVVSVNEAKLRDTITLVVVNGNYSESLSDKIILNGLHINSFANLDESEKAMIASQANVEKDAFIALNTAFSGSGFHLKIEKNAQLQIPVHIIYVSSAEGEALVNPRNFIELGENSEATIIEHQVNASGKVFSNFLSEKLVRENARLTAYTVQDEGSNGYSVNTNQVKLERSANYSNTTVILSGQLVRNNHNIVIAGEGAEAHLNGLFVTGGSQLVDNHTLMDHQVPHCQSNELYKGIINDKSTGVFNGKIYVRKDAQKTNAYQSSKNILLSDDATINTKPELEIYADDVKCSHGTSTGKIDESAMFYLNARGISSDNAKVMLLNAFAEEIIDRIDIDSVKELVQEKLGFN
jgi:Fe-S cluster assembly protein SufD